MQPLIHAGPIATFPEANPLAVTPGPLSNAENLLVDLSVNGEAQLITQAYATGVAMAKLHNLDNSVGVVLAGSGAIAKITQDAAIPINAPVKGVTTVGPSQGRIIASAAGDVSIGIKVGPTGGGTAGDFAYVMLGVFKN